MLRILALALLVALPAAAEKNAVVRFRLAKDTSVELRGRIVAYDHQRFVLQEFGRGAKRALLWKDVKREDAARIRRRLGLELPTGSGPDVYVPGHEIRFKGGHVLEGLLVRVDAETGRHWIKRGGVTLPYPGERIKKVKEVELPESDVYDPEEVYARRLLREPPKNAREHIDLAQYLYEIGNFKRARDHYAFAARLEAVLGPTVAPRIARIDEYLADERAAKVFKTAMRRGVLHGDPKGAEAIVKEFVGENPEFKRSGLRLLDEINDRHAARAARRFMRVKHEAVDRSIEKYLATRKPSCDEAMAWIRTNLAGAVREKVKKRLEITDEQYEELLKLRKKARGAPHFATYKDGTFIIAKRLGKKANVDGWWGRYGDATTHVPFLKAYAAEKLPDLFEVQRITFTDCTRCGATGKVRKMSFRSSRGSGTNEWKEICPRCHGNQRDRGVIYR